MGEGSFDSSNGHPTVNNHFKIRLGYIAVIIDIAFFFSLGNAFVDKSIVNTVAVAI